MIRVTLITIGDELLKGRIVNTNTTQIGSLLRRHGYSLQRNLTISDNRDAIGETVTEALESSDIVLACGGLGPTRDDITKHTLAELFHSQLVWHAPTLAFLEARLAARGRVLNELTRRQALVPDVCEVVPNPNGTAPGMMFRRGQSLLFCMPGVPFEMIHMLEDGVLPRMKAAFSPGYFDHRIVRMTDIPESDAAMRMETFENEKHPALAVSYLPRLDGLWIEVSVRMEENERGEAEQILNDAWMQVRGLFADKIYAIDERSLPDAIGAALRSRGLTLAVAESLTGGKIAASIVSVSGASDYFKGSVTAYAVSVKTSVLHVPQEVIDSHGVVSEAVARAMAEQVRLLLGADLGLATTGLAEKDGDEFPRAWIAVADAAGSEARLLNLHYDRPSNIEYVSNYALRMGLERLAQ